MRMSGHVSQPCIPAQLERLTLHACPLHIHTVAVDLQGNNVSSDHQLDCCNRCEKLDLEGLGDSVMSIKYSKAGRHIACAGVDMVTSPVHFSSSSLTRQIKQLPHQLDCASSRLPVFSVLPLSLCILSVSPFTSSRYPLPTTHYPLTNYQLPLTTYHEPLLLLAKRSPRSSTPQQAG